MTEAEWLGCNDSKPMLKYLRSWIPESQWGVYTYLITRAIGLRLKPRASSRKLRLFAVACSSYNAARMMEEPYRKAVEVGERLADGKASHDEVRRAHAAGPFAATFTDPAAAATLAAGAWTLFGDVMAAYLRDVVGNPFRRIAIDDTWLARNDGAVHQMAQAIYDARAFDRLPLLADALEDGGCDNADILSHCRSGGEHVRGCWVVDLLLGKS